MTDTVEPGAGRPAVSIDRQIAEVDREIGMRRGFYQKQVRLGEMDHQEAIDRLNAMRAVGSTLRWVKRNAERLRRLHLEEPSEPEAAT